MVTQEAHKLGFVEQANSVKQISSAEADSLSPAGSVLWGTNGKEQAQRARTSLGWKPKGRSLEEEIPGTVQAEADSLLGKL